MIGGFSNKLKELIPLHESCLFTLEKQRSTKAFPCLRPGCAGCRLWWGKDGVVWAEALFCFEERRSPKDYLRLLGYSPCSSPLQGISCGLFWENNLHFEFKMGFLRAPSLNHRHPKIPRYPLSSFPLMLYVCVRTADVCSEYPVYMCTASIAPFNLRQQSLYYGPENCPVWLLTPPVLSAVTNLLWCL